jgi:Rps23 Pro-64 3,4-dihydroxylase Tpa1-like proline 4-hydroxylase
MSFELSKDLEKEAIRRDFESQGYVQIPNVLPPEVAKRIYAALLGDTPWNLVFTDRGKHVDMLAAQLEVMDSKQVIELQQAIYAQAQQDFQYCYNNYSIYDACKAGINKGHVLHDFYEWLNGEEFIAFAQAATGFDDISFLDAQATRYKPGHFLTTHDDILKGKKRRAAYIFGFSSDWPADWGGFLQLLDENDNARIGLKPSYNTLNILAIPQRHNVSIVAPFAGGMRQSISGWLRYGDPE